MIGFRVFLPNHPELCFDLTEILCQLISALCTLVWMEFDILDLLTNCSQFSWARIKLKFYKFSLSFDYSILPEKINVNFLNKTLVTPSGDPNRKCIKCFHSVSSAQDLHLKTITIHSLFQSRQQILICVTLLILYWNFCFCWFQMLSK